MGAFAGCVLMVASMLLWNYCITPLYMQTTREAVKNMLVPVFLPFNMIKGGINSVLLIIIYNALHKFSLDNSNFQ